MVLTAKYETCPLLIGQIENWLLNSPVRVRQGPYRGGVAGWLNEEGLPEFLYPEVAGYYLTWLSSLGPSSGEHVGNCARQVISWAAEQFHGDELPATRLHMKGEAEEWRNCGTFSFDLAMLLRGAATAASQVDNSGADRLISHLLACLQRFCSEGTILPFLPIRNSVQLPPKWSVLPGPHQTKTALAILSLPRNSVPSDLWAAAVSLYWHWNRYFANRKPEGEAHPLFYHLEGLVLAGAYEVDPDAWFRCCKAYSDLMALQAEDGSLPSSLNEPGTCERSDVLAQGLRIGCLLVARNYLRGRVWNEKLWRLFAALQAYIDRNGAVRFSSGAWPQSRHRNTWSAIFTHQALRLLQSSMCGELPGTNLVNFLV
jgi:hypothetical protein